MDLLQRYPRQRDDVAARTVGDSAVVVTLGDHLVHELDAVATFVWQQCDGRTRGSEILERLVQEFEVDRDRAAADLAQLLATLRDRALLELPEQPAPASTPDGS